MSRTCGAHEASVSGGACVSSEAGVASEAGSPGESSEARASGEASRSSEAGEACNIFRKLIDVTCCYNAGICGYSCNL